MKVNKVLLKSASILLGVATLSNIVMANDYVYLDEGISKIDFSTTDENILNEISKEDEILKVSCWFWEFSFNICLFLCDFFPEDIKKISLFNVKKENRWICGSNPTIF